MSEQEIYNAEEMPLSNDPTLQVAQQKLLNGEELSFDEKFIIGRDRTIKSLAGYKFKPDHVLSSYIRKDSGDI